MGTLKAVLLHTPASTAWTCLNIALGLTCLKSSLWPLKEQKALELFNVAVHSDVYTCMRVKRVLTLSMLGCINSIVWM